MQRLLILTFILILPVVTGCCIAQRTWTGFRGDSCTTTGCPTAQPVPGFTSTISPSLSTELPGPAMTTPATGM